MKKLRNYLILCILLFGICSTHLQVQAAGKKTIYNSPYVSFSPDEMAWTTNMGDRTFSWYSSGERVSTGIPSSLRALRTGEHYYRYARKDEIPIGYWQVEHRPAHCIHKNYPSEGDAYHGISFGRQICGRNYYSGWQAYCADCGDNILNFLVYMSRNAAQSIQYIPLRTSEGNSITYFYLCPHCSNLEQGVKISDHQCTTISKNRYKVIYHPNVPEAEEGRVGVMQDSIHMYDNASLYEENSVTPITRLTYNSYTRLGYVFDGWNTQADGSGDTYKDGQAILNLTTENCDNLAALSGEKGVVTLYAQWRKSESILLIQPNGGSYGGRKTVTRIRKAYGEEYFLNEEPLTTPDGYTISFDTMGGNVIPSITGTTHFKEWEQKQPFAGQIYKQGTPEEKYLFTAPNGNVDTVTARYEADAVVLPEANKSGYSFGGWYQNPDFTTPVGAAGDTVTPTKDMVLYAQWVDLTLKAKDNYKTDGGKGAVDLSWSQSDGSNKVYMLYQSRDGTNWTKINDSADISNSSGVNQIFPYTGSIGTYAVPYTGLYTLTAAGAKGANYSQYLGGCGGVSTLQVWLSKGEILTYAVGGMNGYNCGGSGSSYGNGGGMTNVISNRKGTLLIGAGGGGASPAGNGGAGGVASGVSGTYNQGQSGMAGGGGGYYGGRQGDYVVHSHTWGVCNHVHSGSASFGGGCYVKNICGGQIINVKVGRYYGNRDMNGKLVYCIQCASYSCGGHDKFAQRCSVCSTSYTYGEALTRNYKCDAGGGYKLGCGKTENYVCGYSQGQVISAKPGYGGSNYYNISYARSYATQSGVQNGNGYLKIQSNVVGYSENLSLNNVTATDMEKPDAVDGASVRKTAEENQQITVSWIPPKDRGTTYYHMAESYLTGSSKVLCKSNITSNTLTSGIKGYYVLTDGNSSTNMTAANGIFRTDRKFTVKLENKPRYLHIAAVDVAGNVSDTIHVNFGTGEETDVAWKLYTGQMTIEEGDNVYSAARNVYYVKSDGETPVQLQMKSYMDGFPTKDYQINYTIFETTSEGQQGRSIAKTENATITDGEIRRDGGNLDYTEEGTLLLKRYPYAYTLRRNRNAEMIYVQKFTIDRAASGKTIEVIPVAGADYGKEIIYSDYRQDKNHGLRLIADGSAPNISGLEIMNNLQLINRGNQSIHLDVFATDNLSGVGEFWVKISNTDNAVEKTYLPDTNGVISLDITAEDPIFSGDFTVTAYAVDNVGNKNTLQYGTTEFQLTARIERILEPHEPLFKRGESGILTITTWGYADKVEVIFPEEMTAWNPELNHVYSYIDSPGYKQEENLQFMIPLRMPENGSYEITVKAYKGDKKLEEHPSLKTLSVDGTILDDVRTRLR